MSSSNKIASLLKMFADVLRAYTRSNAVCRAVEQNTYMVGDIVVKVDKQVVEHVVEAVREGIEVAQTALNGYGTGFVPLELLVMYAWARVGYAMSTCIIRLIVQDVVRGMGLKVMHLSSLGLDIVRLSPGGAQSKPSKKQ